MTSEDLSGMYVDLKNNVFCVEKKLNGNYKYVNFRPEEGNVEQTLTYDEMVDKLDSLGASLVEDRDAEEYEVPVKYVKSPHETTFIEIDDRSLNTFSFAISNIATCDAIRLSPKNITYSVLLDGFGRAEVKLPENIEAFGDSILIDKKVAIELVKVLQYFINNGTLPEEGEV